MANAKVLVVGAGPTGLTLAIELARRDIAVRVIDKSPEHFVGSRGKGLAPRSHEVLHNLGALDAMEPSGFRHLPYRRWINGRLVSDADPTANQKPTPGAPYESGMLIAQWQVEQVLRDTLASHGVDVELGTELIDVTQSPEGVVATLGTRTGTAQVSADYLIGCDGGRSTVRGLVNATFDGESGPQSMLVGDVHVEGLRPDAWYMWTVANKGFVALCPFRSWSQWQFQATPIADFTADGRLPAPSVEYFQRIFDDIAGVDGVRLSNPTWLSTWSPNVRMVEEFRYGRVILAGDAAHVHPPTGGLGMNTGIQDAHNLGWKLAMVLGGKAGDDLLDTFTEERLPVAKWTLDASARELENVRGDVAGLRDQMKEAMAERGFRPNPNLQREQLAIGYHWSSLARDVAERPDGSRAGDRAPGAPCQDAAGKPVRLFDVFRTPWFTLLGFGTETRDALDSAAEKYPDLVTSQLVESEAGPDVDLVDVHGHAHREYAITEPALVLIRPDGHLALTAPAAQGAAVLDYLAGISR